MSESVRGRLLVATPDLADPNFSRTVVLVIEHGPEGALGVVLNRPGGLDVDEPLPQWATLAAPPSTVFVGGPVAPGSVIALGRAAAPGLGDGWVHLFGDLGAVDVGRDPAGLTPGIEALRIFSGYAGWSPGQLDGELESGGWFVVDLDPADVFTPEPHRLWSAVLRRQPGRIRIFAMCPPDPSVN